jgi:hypothetical protein
MTADFSLEQKDSLHVTNALVCYTQAIIAKYRTQRQPIPKA